MGGHSHFGGGRLCHPQQASRVRTVCVSMGVFAKRPLRRTANPRSGRAAAIWASGPCDAPTLPPFHSFALLSRLHRALLRDEIAQTLDDPAQAAEEPRSNPTPPFRAAPTSPCFSPSTTSLPAQARANSSCKLSAAKPASVTSPGSTPWLQSALRWRTVDDDLGRGCAISTAQGPVIPPGTSALPRSGSRRSSRPDRCAIRSRTP